MNAAAQIQQEQIRPLGDRVLVRRDPRRNPVSPGGIVLVVSEVETKAMTGEVVAAGEKAAITVGRRVLFGRFQGSEVKADGGEYVLVRDDDVLAYWDAAGGFGLHRDNLLVLFDATRDARKDERVTEGGIIVPKTGDGLRPNTHDVPATVVAIGPGCHRRYIDPKGVEVDNPRVWLEPPCAVGDRVLVDVSEQGQRYDHNGLEHRIVRFHNIEAVLEAS